ncbi:ubinuclein-1 isoform X2 [Leptidea sinapis]|uniref:ubinuclein-1 isoform X2 n=1 Tax=Leptidea sinapis TaxID=189913 RepID=UPI002131142C|nr:ubinuclein-1 isoform X2 [Leptidea sinapis]
MSDSKRATLITVGAPKSAKNNVNKTIRLTINLDESNESKYPELNYKELVIATAAKKRTENGKTAGLDPFSDNDDDVERVARKFEQKYGGKSTYGRKGRSKYEEFADIGAGYDENDSFIDNTHGYDEMIPPECDTLYGGFYINSGSLEFKTVPEKQILHSDGEPRRNKRRISSSSSEDESSDSSSGSDSHETKETKTIANGKIDSHKTEHRKKKSKPDKKKQRKIGDSSAANSGKQTSDETAPCSAESDSQTSQSMAESGASKPAPSSENPATSDSSRDTEAKLEVKLPEAVTLVLEEMEKLNSQVKTNPGKDTDDKIDQLILKLERALAKASCDGRARRVCSARAATSLSLSRAALLKRATALIQAATLIETQSKQPPTASSSTTNSIQLVNKNGQTNPVNCKPNRDQETLDVNNLTQEQKEVLIVETLQKLKLLIDDQKPGMISAYNTECERVQVERKKIQEATAGGTNMNVSYPDKRLPKRRFPWCSRSRSLLTRLARLAGAPHDAAALLATRALPLFPAGFVRMPTLLRQASLNKDIKASDLKRRVPPTQPSTTTATNSHTFNEPIQFPSSLTVTTTIKGVDKEDEKKTNSAIFNTTVNSYTINKEVVNDKLGDREKKNVASLSSITITPFITKPEKKDKTKEPLIRVKSPAALNEMVTNNNKKEKKKEKEKDKFDTPLHIDTNNIPKKDAVKSPRAHELVISQKQIEHMKAKENNLPHPALVPVNHSPTFAKPDKRPPEKKKKDIVIVSDLDPLGDIPQEPVAVDDSSSDIEVIEDKSEKDKCDSGKVNSANDCNSVKSDYVDETRLHIDKLMKELKELQHSQDETNCNSYEGAIKSAKHESSKQAFSRPTVLKSTERDKLSKYFERNRWM